MITKVYEKANNPVESFTLSESEDDVYLRASIDRSDDSIYIEFLQHDFWVFNGDGNDAMTINELIEGLTDLKKALETE